MSSSPVVLYNATVCESRGDERRAPLLGATLPLLLARGADQLIVPAPSFRTEKERAEAVRSLPEARRHMVRVVDEDGQILERVREFLAPIRTHVCHAAGLGMPRVLDFIYQFAIATRYRAAILDDSLQRARTAVLAVDAHWYAGEAKCRLAEVVRLVAAYSPVVAPQSQLMAELTEPTPSLDVWKILDDASYSSVTVRFGRLGFLRQPRLAMQRLIRRWREVLTRPTVQEKLKFAQAVGDVSPASSVANPFLSAIAAIPRRAAPFVPPFVPLLPATTHAINRTALPTAAWETPLFRETHLHGDRWSTSLRSTRLLAPFNEQPDLDVELGYRSESAAAIRRLQNQFV